MLTVVCHYQHISSISFFAVIWNNGDSRCVCVWLYFKSGMEGAFNIDPLKRANRSNDIVSLWPCTPDVRQISPFQVLAVHVDTKWENLVLHHY